jgi:hypothetical protein
VKLTLSDEERRGDAHLALRRSVPVSWRSHARELGLICSTGVVTLFAVFEKRCNDVMRLLHKLKDWE